MLQDEWEAIQGADRSEIEFCEAAAGLGWDPYDMGDDERSLVVELGHTLSGAVLEEAIAAFNARSLMTECSAITGAIACAKANALRWEPLAVMDHELPAGGHVAAPTPWEAGYDLSRDAAPGPESWTASRYRRWRELRRPSTQSLHRSIK